MNKNIDNIKFGKQVSKLRLKTGLSQEAFAYKCNINRTYMGEIERGEVNPSLSTIIKIANGLGISKQQLLDYE